MKRLILIITVFLTTNCLFSQEPISYSGVVETDSVSKEILYKRGLLWIANAFKDSKEVIQLKDENSGQIISKGTFKYNGKDDFYRGFIEFKLELYFKDGRYKYVITDFYHKGEMMNIGLITNQEEAPFKAFGSTKFYRDREWNNIKSEIGSTVNQLTESMQKSITKPSEVEKDNW